ncbi:hypothetical protein SUGI_1522050 [Cryptomeria japonica]|uniref:Uncharacterized protein n=1 Tax=Cryptomeria japonica TaxID=3369 RepID=A0AAD3NWB7_CRYJA|nr:hypothetical protein SUGI_1522050 [Cryptomeria japonica]
MWSALFQVESCCEALHRRKEEERCVAYNVERPVPSRELLRGPPSKEGGLSRSVRRRRPREAGFTEQRQPPAPYSGRIMHRLPL